VFGMKDYRAHNLYWLLSLPLWLFGRILFLAVAILLPMIVVSLTHYEAWLQIVIAYVAMETVLLVLLFVFVWFNYLFKRLFYFFIDVEPSVGRTPDEVKSVLLHGAELVKLDRKLTEQVQDWDVFEDTDRYVKLFFNWRQKLFFGTEVKQRFRETVRELQHINQETGEQPTLATIKEIHTKIKSGKPSFMEKAIRSTYYWNSIVGFCIIMLVTLKIH
jgi:hypothetical protein